VGIAQIEWGDRDNNAAWNRGRSWFVNVTLQERSMRVEQGEEFITLPI
jgi:hypothetical protein